MAEAAGLALGAVSILGLFNNCVDSFEYIQIGKSVGKNYQTCQLKLDGARIALSRWGASIGLEDTNEAKTLKDLKLNPKHVEKAEEFLGQIEDLFEDGKTKASRYQVRAKAKDGGQALVLHDSQKDLKGSGLKLHESMRNLSLRRQGTIKLRDKARWALYEAKEYERLVTDINELVQQLVTLFPAAQPAQKQIAEAEVEEIKKADALPLAQEAALDSDKALKDAIDGVMKASGQTIYYNTANIQGDHNTGVMIGQQFGNIHHTSSGGPKQ